MLTFDQFIATWLGKKCDFDGAYAGQCVDLFRQYVQDVLGNPQPKGVVGAADFWTNYPTDPNLNGYFERIANSPTGVPAKGDVVLWNKSAGGGYGHVAMFISGDTNTFTSFDQNYPTLSVCTKTTHNYTNVLGWLHPKKAPMADTIQVEKAVFESLVTKATKLDDLTKTGYVLKPDYDKKVAEMDSSIKDLETKLFECQSKPVGVPVDMTKWELNGLQVVDGAYIKNYKLKG